MTKKKQYQEEVMKILSKIQSKDKEQTQNNKEEKVKKVSVIIYSIN